MAKWKSVGHEFKGETHKQTHTHTQNGAKTETWNVRLVLCDTLQDNEQTNSFIQDAQKLREVLKPNWKFIHYSTVSLP